MPIHEMEPWGPLFAPVPPEVKQAIETIGNYLSSSPWVECRVSAKGSSIFALKSCAQEALDIYDIVRASDGPDVADGA